MHEVTCGQARHVQDAEGQRLDSLRGYRLADVSTAAAFDEFARIAAYTFRTKMASVALLAEDDLWLVGGLGLDWLTIPRSDSFSSTVVGDGQMLVVPDAALDPRFAQNPQVVGPSHVRFYAGAPLIVPGGHVLGAICVLDTVPREFGERDQEVLQSLAGRVVDSIELQSRTLELEQERELLSSTSQVLAMIASGADLGEVLTAVARAMERRDPEVLCSILLREGPLLRDGAGPSLPASYRSAIDGITWGPGVGCCGEAAYTGRSAVAVDIDQDPRWAPFLELTRAAGLRACWSTPILDGIGQVLGTFGLYFHEPRTPRAEHWALAQQWSDLAGLAIMRTRERAQVQTAASTDALTGLPNRTALLAACADALADPPQDGPVALLFIDLDRFKVLNDSLGHAIGDEYLREIATRLRATAGSAFLLARFGGDEFVLLASGAATRAEVLAVGQRLVESARQSVTLGHREVALSLSIGIAFATEPGQSALSLLRNADAALYRAKDLGRDRVDVFDSALHDAAVHRLETEESLHQGLTKNQFSLVYQPKVDLVGGAVIGVEALLRWTHPELGAIPPAEFIPIAEECGVIVSLGAWVVEEALAAHAARWLVDPTWREVVMWVNVAPSQLTPALPTLVRRVVADLGIPATVLGVEVTEGSLMTDLPVGRLVLEELRELGVHIALDDFGTGYSSLAQLKHLPVEALKIDKTFIDGLGSPGPDTGIVVAVIGLARAHGLKVVAEGVETIEQLRVLTALDCDAAQGYYFGRPGALGAVRSRYVVPDRSDRRIRSLRRTGTS